MLSVAIGNSLEEVMWAITVGTAAVEAAVTGDAVMMGGTTGKTELAIAGGVSATGAAVATGDDVAQAVTELVAVAGGVVATRSAVEAAVAGDVVVREAEATDLVAIASAVAT